MLLHSSHQRMTNFVVSDNLLFLCRNNRALALITGDNSFNGFLQILLLHDMTLHTHSTQRALVDDIRQLCTARTSRRPRQRAIINIIGHLHSTRMHPQDSLTALQIRQLNRHTTVKTARTQQRLV